MHQLTTNTVFEDGNVKSVNVEIKVKYPSFINNLVRFCGIINLV